ncbi:CASP8 and FADD-like apoptosis regulator a [Colossoma macropomum]|uniref:CASP8 and FADD-like apoptosis regulator a n=1 Tax=Colossoma macropomum TaxID=42526 RepID=UPI0018656168|nr:CASP8 and FADD-like apoptosis regulator a [Colossoma macropomum]
MADGLCLLVNSVVEALSQEECRTLRYLCSDLLSANCAEDCRGALITLMTQTAHSRPRDTVLKEVLFRLNRFDLLRRLLGTTRMDVEEMLKARGRVLSDYRVLMMELSESLDTAELQSLTFLLSSSVPRGPLERATSFLDVVAELEKMDKVSCEKLDQLEQYLRNIRRVDLANRIQSYQRDQHRTQREVSQSPAARNGTQVGLGHSHNHRAPVRKQQPLPEEFKTLKLSVPESGVQRSEVPVDQRYTDSECGGVCVIIDCVGFDGDLLKDTFERLGFRVHLHTLLTARELSSVLRSVSEQRALQRAATFCCCLLSRGSETHLLATDAEGPGFALTDLRQIFCPTRCPLLAGKPKLFFTQSYVEAPPTLEQEDPCLETDGVPYCAVPTHASARETLPAAADVLWSVCTTSAWQLERRDHHSVYLQALSSALLRAHERKLHVLDALIEVNRDVYEHNRQNPDNLYHLKLSHTLRKSLCL